jgi:hypothetical protein
MRIGIIGLPNAGKSSLYNLLTQAGARVESYPFTTIECNVGVAAVPDEDLKELGELLHPKKLTPTTVEFTDIAGLVEGASQGEGLGNRFLAHIREADLLLHLLRAFPDPSIPHQYGMIDPTRDEKVVEAELAIADLELIDRRLERLARQKKPSKELTVLSRLKEALSRGESISLSSEESSLLKGFGLFKLKPRLCMINFGSEPMELQYPAGFFALSVRLEEEMEGFPELERKELRRELGLDPRGPAGLISEAFDRLGLIRFYTIKGDETRAWGVPKGTSVVEAAGLIHSDLATGFIRAEVVKVKDLLAAGGFLEAQKAGKIGVEGREYEVQDGDVILVKFRT